MASCPNCGEPVQDTDLFCTLCGEPLPRQEGQGPWPEGGPSAEESTGTGVTARARQLVQAASDQIVIGAQMEAAGNLSVVNGLFRSQGDQVVVRPDVDITVMQPAQASFCPVCRGYHPQSELFLCPSCKERIGLEHRVPALGICSRCAERSYELALRFVLKPTELGHYRLLVSSDMLEPAWSAESDFELDRMPSDWDQRLAQVADHEAIAEQVLIEQVGQPLFEAVFGPDLWLDLEEPFDGRTEWQGVHFKLVDLPPALAGWPWEFLCRDDDFLALSRHTPIIRWMTRRGTATLGPESSPLRVLVVTSNGAEEVSSPSAIEADLLRAGLEEADVAPLLEFVPMKFGGSASGGQPDLADILRRHLQSHVHVLHLAGALELGFGSDDGPPTLFLQGEGTSDQLSLDTLGRWLEDSSVQVIVLGSRLLVAGESVSPLDPRLRLEDRLLRGDVAALVAFQYDLLPGQVRDFAQAFYGTLASRARIDFLRPGLPQALAAGRKALLDPDTGAGTRAWAAPVLFARPVEGCFLDLSEVEEVAIEEEAIDYGPFVEEELLSLDPDEAPLCIEDALEALRRQRVQLVVGEPDAGTLDLARQMAHRLAQEGDCDLILRFPRYQPRGGFLPALRSLAQTGERLAILLDSDNWERSTEELTDMIRLTASRDVPLYCVLAINMKAMPEATTEFGLWVQQNPSLCTPLGKHDYDSEILQRILNRVLQEARKAGQLHPTTVRTLLAYAEDRELFGSDELQIALPGQLVRFVYGQLVGQPPIADPDGLRPALQALSDVHEDVQRWFSERLDDSQRVLVMCLALLQGLPTHLFSAVYRLIVGHLRKTFHLDLSVLPVRAELRRWTLYLHEVKRQNELLQDAVFVEFTSEVVETDILTLLRADYGEWLVELVPMLGDLACGNTPSGDKSPSRDEAEQRAMQLATVRALGEIGRGSPRLLGLVAADLERWLTAEWPSVPDKMEYQVRALPGHVLRYVAEDSNHELDTEIISTLARWRRHDQHKVRWAAASACGRLAHVLSMKRLLPVYLALARDARQTSHEAFQRALRKTNDLGKAAASPVYQSAVGVYQSATYALRMFLADDYEQLRRLYDHAAGDGNFGVRINAAIALNQVAADRPDVARDTIFAWANPHNWSGTQKWACWWTAAAAITLLVENERLPDDELRDTLAHLLTMAALVTSRSTPQALGRVSSDLVWAMGTCTGQAPDERSKPIPLVRTFALMGSLLGQDPWWDSVIHAVFQRAAVADPRQRAGMAKAIFQVMRHWLQPKDYQLVPARRQVAVEAYLNAGSSRWNEACRLLRDLAQFEAYDYGTLQSRSVEALALEWLGVGGLVLQAVLGGGDTVLAGALPILRTMASIKEPHVRPIAPFVMTQLAEAHPTLVMDAVESWAMGPQWTLQMSAAETALGLCLLGQGSPDRLADILSGLARTARLEVQDYLENQLGSLAEVDLPMATRLREALDAPETMEVY